MARPCLIRQVSARLLREINRQERWRASLLSTGCIITSSLTLVRNKEAREVGLHREARLEGVGIGIGRDLRGVNGEVLATDQPCGEALFHDPLEEATEDRQSIAFPDPGEAGVVWEGIAQVVANVPAQTEPVSNDPQQLPLRAQPLEEQHQLELEEHDRVNGRTAAQSIAVSDQIPYEAQVKRPLQVPVEVVCRHQILQRHRWQRGKIPVLGAHHGQRFLPHCGSAEEPTSSHLAIVFFNRLDRIRDVCLQGS